VLTNLKFGLFSPLVSQPGHGLAPDVDEQKCSSAASEVLGLLVIIGLSTWKLHLFLEHWYQPVSSFLLTAAISLQLGLKMPYGEIDFR